MSNAARDKFRLSAAGRVGMGPAKGTALDRSNRTKLTAKPRLESTVWLRFMLFWWIVIGINFNQFFARGSGRLLVVASVVAFLFCSAALRRLELIRPCLPVALLLMVGLFGTPGVIYNKATGQETGLFTAIFLITIVLHAQLLPRRSMRIDPALWLKTIQWLGLGLLVFSIIDILDRGYGDGTMLFHTPWHEAGFLLPLGLLAAYFRSRMVALGLGLALLSAIIALDVRTTTAMSIVITLGLLALSALPRVLFMRISAVLVVLGTISYSASYSMIKSFNSSLKSSMGGLDNSDFRESLIEFGLDRVWESPVFGDFFSGPSGFSGVIKGVLDEEGQPVLGYPLHNDWLQIALSGGLVGFTLYFAAFATCGFMGFRTYYGFLARSMRTHAKLTLLLTIGLVSSMFSITVNPVINVVHTGLYVYSLFALVVIMRRVYAKSLIP